MADLVMVGAGPQALTLSCLVLQKRPRLQRRLRIMDPSGRWLSRWQRQMERYEIPWLRSPSPHHPHPNAHALRRFAHRQQRQRQLEGAYGLPHTDLFAAFCREVISEFALEERVQAASVEHISLPANGTGPIELSLSDGATVQAGRVVIATGSGTPQWPAWIKAIAAGSWLRIRSQSRIGAEERRRWERRKALLADLPDPAARSTKVRNSWMCSWVAI